MDILKMSEKFKSSDKVKTKVDNDIEEVKFWK